LEEEAVKICVITLARNEERIMPFFLRHYLRFLGVDEVVVWDHASSDRTRDIVASYPHTRLASYNTGGLLDDGEHSRIKSYCYRNQEPHALTPPLDADWYIMVDCDELLYHPNLRAYLADGERQGWTVPLVCGINMVSESDIPPDDGVLLFTDWCKTGVAAGNYGKRCVVHRSAVMDYGPGCHSQFPHSGVVDSPTHEIKLLHYEYLSAERVLAKYRRNQKTLSDKNKAYSWGTHCFFDEPNVVSRFNCWIKERTQVIP
jgi:glycosyltransferase involved in cell wall biosynthesis